MIRKIEIDTISGIGKAGVGIKDELAKQEAMECNICEVWKVDFARLYKTITGILKSA